MFCLHVCYVHLMHAVPSEVLELKLQGFVSCHVGTRTELWFSEEQPVLSTRVISPLSHQHSFEGPPRSPVPTRSGAASFPILDI